MENLKSLLKLALAAALIALLVGAAFLLGYRAGSLAEDISVDDRAEQTTSSEAGPSATAPPTNTAEATKTQESTESLIRKTPEPADTSQPPAATEAPVEVNNADSATPAADSAVNADEEVLHVLDEVWELIDREFFGELPPPEERAYGAIRGMLGTLGDDYTSFSEPSIADIRRVDATGAFEGIGATVRMNDENVLEIVQPFKDSPAEKAGLLPGDRVLSVDGQTISGYGIYEAITLIRGPEGTSVTLVVQRDDAEPFEVAIVRARLEIPIVESEMLEDAIGYVSLFEFSSPATARLNTAIEELIDQGAAALVFDLRGNPGGFLDQAVQVSDVFLDEGLVLIERRSDGEEIEFTSSDDGQAQDIPLAVLINGGSASASEIVAGAIQDRARGVLIGETTFGKGSVQLVHTLSDGSELRVTVARWFTPNGHAIHGEGLAPNIDVPVTPEDLEADRDPQLERAIEYLREGQ